MPPLTQSEEDVDTQQDFESLVSRYRDSYTKRGRLLDQQTIAELTHTPLDPGLTQQISCLQEDLDNLASVISEIASPQEKESFANTFLNQLVFSDWES